ncbi:DUF945 family protein [Halomonas elongata]|uniref:DUF945 domain protein n=2 Tax=Halomonas elongata TaxID=2746 RepID=E1V7N1_HALED|nr:DUF945 family protein [Halomonas elongata]MBW5799452.1 YdgA family protein [Halomonas elongata]MDL4863531.1 DUF945 family protein [Halomonas elongata]OBX34281.1 hypothetical protein A8U91_03334 [Halomonas elongata]RAW06253.1 DUF945 family protein [Halomonas elongata]WBF17215.1 YdgA family protein [Halomonas elongata]
MRKERLIVPVVVAVAVAWAVAQTIASLMFERELARAIQDLQARGELSIWRSETDQGWLTSTGVIHLAPLFGDGWHLDISYRARHGLLSTRMDGYLQQHRERTGQARVEIARKPPAWEARYHPLSGTFDGTLKLSPLVLRQEERTLALHGARLALQGEFGDWKLNARLESARLDDGETTLEAGPVTLESRYTYIDGAYHFTQRDLLKVNGVHWRSPSLSLDADELVLHSKTDLDEQELRIRSELSLGEVMSADQVLMTGKVVGELSRINADALRSLLNHLKAEAARGGSGVTRRDLLSLLAPQIRALMGDSPRLDLLEVDLDSPMLGLSLEGEGALIFDARDLEELDPEALESSEGRSAWRERLDGDFLWRDLPAVVALWLGLPLDTEDMQIDVVRGKVRINGRPLPSLSQRLP